MKKLLLLSIILMASLSSFAANYFTMGENDTLRISPNCIGDVVTIPVRLHLDGRIDSWSLTLTYPNALHPGLVLRGAAMSIPYIKSDGTDDIYQAVITDANIFTTLSSIITDFGYWDYNNDGIYEPYGTIKWEAGDQDPLFKITCSVDYDCTGDSITLDGTLSSTYDWRGGTTNGCCYKKIYIYFGYQRGDVNGNGVVDINDVTLLIECVMGQPTQLDSYQLAAADVNGDGLININDVTALIAIVNGTNGIEDPLSPQGGGVDDLEE